MTEASGSRILNSMPEPIKKPPEQVEVSVNPYKSPSFDVPRPKRPPRRLNGQFWRGIACLIAGSFLTALSVYWFLYGTGFMLMVIIALGPALILAGFIYLFFWYDD
jgi:hypothetical protein